MPFDGCGFQHDEILINHGPVFPQTKVFW